MLKKQKLNRKFTSDWKKPTYILELVLALGNSTTSLEFYVKSLQFHLFEAAGKRYLKKLGTKFIPAAKT